MYGAEGFYDFGYDVGGAFGLLDFSSDDEEWFGGDGESVVFEAVRVDDAVG